MSLRNLLQRKLIACSPETPIKEVARLMDRENVGAILVANDREPVGIVTDRDIVIRCVCDGMDCENQPVERIMTRDLETVDIDSGLYDVIQVMKENSIRRVPVVDDEGRAIGLLSFGDIFQLIGKEISDLTATVTPEEPKIVQQAA